LIAILRLTPGDIASWTSRYALVGHYGEPVGVTVMLKAGDTMPFAMATTDYEPPLWWLPVADVITRAA
jgi:hypothetical protein